MAGAPCGHGMLRQPEAGGAHGTGRAATLWQVAHKGVRWAYEYRKLRWLCRPSIHVTRVGGEACRLGGQLQTFLGVLELAVPAGCL